MLAGLENSEFGLAHAGELLAAAAREGAGAKRGGGRSREGAGAERGRAPSGGGRGAREREEPSGGTTERGGRASAGPDGAGAGRPRGSAPRQGGRDRGDPAGAARETPGDSRADLVFPVVLAGWAAMVAQFLKLPLAHRARADDLPGVTGTARLDRRTKNLIKRLSPGDIAIIDHRDLDRMSADALIERQVGAVVNVAASISGRYPNNGPQLLMEAGIPLVDEAGPDLFGRVSRGDHGPAARRGPLRRRGARRQGQAADHGDGAGGHGRGQGRCRRPASGVRGEHPGVHGQRGRAAGGRHRHPAAAHPHRGQARARGGARSPPPRGPGHAAVLHPGVQAAHGGRGRRRRRPARSRVPAQPHRRRHGLGLRPRAAMRRRACRARLPGRGGARAGAGRGARAGRGGLPGPGHQRGRGASARRPEGREPDRRGGHPQHPGRVPRPGESGFLQHVSHPAPGGR